MPQRRNADWPRDTGVATLIRSEPIVSIRLHYGRRGRFECEVAAGRTAVAHASPPPACDLAEELRSALEHPLDFPPFTQLFVPGDHVVLALDRETPRAATILAEVWKSLAQRGIEPQSVHILQPGGWDDDAPVDPRSELPASVRTKVGWSIHNPGDKSSQAYLATTAKGERVYLARALVDADVVVSIGALAFDSLIGYRGTSSVFYPGLSSSDAVRQAAGIGHSELTPEDERPLRQLIDEVAWLLGSLFSIQVVPSSGSDVASVLAGATEVVLRRGRELLAEHWLFEIDQRADIVVAAVDSDAGGHGWRQIGMAVEAARNLVLRGGTIILLTELHAELTPGLELLRDSKSPRDALHPLRNLSPVDLVPASQLAQAADWADVYLHSRLDDDVVRKLFMLPVVDDQGVRQLLDNRRSCVFLQSAQHTHGQVGAAKQCVRSP
jgi:nickel-dependent lactate racemase